MSRIQKSFVEVRERVHFYCKNIWHAAFSIGECLSIIIACNIVDEDSLNEIENCKRTKMLSERNFEEAELILKNIIQQQTIFSSNNEKHI